MIARLKGKIEEIKPTEMILDVNGVGYHLHIPFSTYEKVFPLGEAILFVFTYHKEDQLKLFGFYTEQEKHLFSVLLNITGIGPSVALSLLSGISPERLIEAVKTENPALLMRVPGIGRTKAEKLIFELKRKMKKLEAHSGEVSVKMTFRNEAVEALVSLGFEEVKSAALVDALAEEHPDASVESLVKQALRRLAL